MTKMKKEDVNQNGEIKKNQTRRFERNKDIILSCDLFRRAPECGKLAIQVLDHHTESFH